jgi:hypothetical protein
MLYRLNYTLTSLYFKPFWFFSAEDGTLDLSVLSKHSTTELHPQPKTYFFITSYIFAEQEAIGSGIS